MMYTQMSKRDGVKVRNIKVNLCYKYAKKAVCRIPRIVPLQILPILPGPFPSALYHRKGIENIKVVLQRFD